MEQVDVCIAGAGIIGLSLALELRSRGRSVLVLERGRAMREASWAAAGMLAADDPELPDALRGMARLSVALYPEFLNRIRSLSGHAVPIRTVETLLEKPRGKGGFSRKAQDLTSAPLSDMEPSLASSNRKWKLIQEASLDPRDLCAALPAAWAIASGSIEIGMREMSDWLPSVGGARLNGAGHAIVQTSGGEVGAKAVVDCRGAWAAGVVPRKGQALSLLLPADIRLTRAIRSDEVYIVPRGDGRALIGATVEDAGFDKSIDDESIMDLVDRADQLVPGIADGVVLERWAGLRPGTPDGLPVLGALPGRQGSFIASGHFRNGILLAPATALLMAQLICGEAPEIGLDAFSPARLDGLRDNGSFAAL